MLNLNVSVQGDAGLVLGHSLPEGNYLVPVPEFVGEFSTEDFSFTVRPTEEPCEVVAPPSLVQWIRNRLPLYEKGEPVTKPNRVEARADRAKANGALSGLVLSPRRTRLGQAELIRADILNRLVSLYALPAATAVALVRSEEDRLRVWAAAVLDHAEDAADVERLRAMHPHCRFTPGEFSEAEDLSTAERYAAAPTSHYPFDAFADQIDGELLARYAREKAQDEARERAARLATEIIETTPGELGFTAIRKRKEATSVLEGLVIPALNDTDGSEIYLFARAPFPFAPPAGRIDIFHEILEPTHVLRGTRAKFSKPAPVEASLARNFVSLRERALDRSAVTTFHDERTADGRWRAEECRKLLVPNVERLARSFGFASCGDVWLEAVRLIWNLARAFEIEAGCFVAMCHDVSTEFVPLVHPTYRTAYRGFFDTADFVNSLGEVLDGTHEATWCAAGELATEPDAEWLATWRRRAHGDTWKSIIAETVTGRDTATVGLLVDALRSEGELPKPPTKNDFSRIRKLVEALGFVKGDIPSDTNPGKRMRAFVRRGATP